MGNDANPLHNDAGAQHACGHDHGCDHGRLDHHHPRTDAICLEQVGYTYPAAIGVAPHHALRDVTLHIEQGCSLGIIGPNGAGKTTLLKIILGLLEGYSGSVSVGGLTPRQACRRGDVIGYVPQRHEAEWHFPVSAEQVVRMGLVGRTGLFRRHSRDDLAYADHIMERVGVRDLRGKAVGDLSGGQQQRLFIARALAPRPKILVLDEPTVGIDEAGQSRFAQLIRELHESLKLTVVIVSHDLQAIAAGCERVACLNQTIHYHDAPGGLTRELLAEVFHHDIAPILGR
ncbi:MAG: metal ABC transporter ATP-binding protein [Planctomycetes bacterium]|nr:metal ABC transporter ATP-binding protein [Planctomycetota bacterium]